VEDDVTAYFEYESGATGVFITTTGEYPGTNRFEVSGTKGKLLCEGNKLWWYKNREDSAEFCKTFVGWGAPALEKIEVETDGKNPQQIGIINNFANAILGLEEQFVQGVDGINGVELMNAMELSGWRNGAEVTLPLDEDEYLKELNLHRATSRGKANVKEAIADTAGTYESKVY
jgi:predicted dehydrogenase